MEKRVRTYDLEAIKLAFSTTIKLRVTGTALRDARAIGFQVDERGHFIISFKEK